MEIIESHDDIFDVLKVSADILCHQVNCFGKMGAGLAKQIKDRYPYTFNQYRIFCEMTHFKTRLGLCLITPTEKNSNKFIANLFGQHGYGRDGVKTDYSAFRSAIKSLRLQIMFNVNQYQTYQKCITLVIPDRIGSGLAGGDHDKIWEIIVDELSPYDIFKIIKVIK